MNAIAKYGFIVIVVAIIAAGGHLRSYVPIGPYIRYAVIITVFVMMRTIGVFWLRFNHNSSGF